MMRVTVLGAFLILLLGQNQHAEAAESFIGTNGVHFMLNGNPLFVNGFNAYWLMNMASDPSQRDKVSTAFKEASINGLTGLDFVICEARRYGISLILSLVNNYDNFGGKKQYVQWAKNQGENIGSDDEFFSNSVVKGYYKNHVKTLITRYNAQTGVAYMNDPTIFAWELMNEPRCPSDASGRTIQLAWKGFMGPHHLLACKTNPGFQVGTDFISNNQISGIDFATLHTYPDQMLTNSSDQSQLQFLNNTLDAHIRDSSNILNKPLLVTEFGKTCKDPGYNCSKRDDLFQVVYSKIYDSARTGGAAAGSLFWQLLVEGMDSLKDGYEVLLNETPTTARIISSESRRLGLLSQLHSK
ncbi:hypothetical protein KFK09_027169 [Dendrobium nobile]|uniref:mannan endo-1,4-beta-mannosidase n=1 Tax=Dendrobium nobile TaxID=94219 RepID=A0A8T3A9Y4_DENNO|nr:hypothetical protein KFK09_027169 [Dendrobium nobile]